MKLEFLVAGVVLFTSSYFLLLLLPEKSQTTKHLVKHDWWTRESFHEWILNFFMLRGQKHISQWMITVLQSCWIISCCFHPLLLLLFYILEKAEERVREGKTCSKRPRVESNRGRCGFCTWSSLPGELLLWNIDVNTEEVSSCSRWILKCCTYINHHSDAQTSKWAKNIRRELTPHFICSLFKVLTGDSCLLSSFLSVSAL